MYLCYYAIDPIIWVLNYPFNHLNDQPNIKNNISQSLNSYFIFPLDTVGCFELHHARSPLQKIPESPKVLQTKFFLYRRNIDFDSPQMIYYEDNGAALDKSSFNFSKPLKVVVHGFMSKWNEKGNLIAADTYLKLVSI